MLNSKFLNISLKTWIMIIITILYLIFKKKPEEFSESCNNFTPPDPVVTEIDNSVLVSDKKIKAYNFNTSWCGYSRSFQSNWDTFANNNSDTDVDIIDVKCDENDNKSLCSKYSIPGYPTVLFVKGENVAEYSGDRSPNDLKKALEHFKNNLN